MTETRKHIKWQHTAPAESRGTECWTCIASGAWGKGGPVNEAIADVHRAAGHDVRPVEERVNRQHAVDREREAQMSNQAKQAGGNQAALGNGCVCDSGCERCDALAEAFGAMREALAKVCGDKVPWHINANSAELRYHFSLDKCRAALALADKVIRGR
jgi:hypothetical protein